MSTKAIFVVCASALFVEIISAACAGTAINSGSVIVDNIGFPGQGAGLLGANGSGFGSGLANIGLGTSGFSGLTCGGFTPASSNGGVFTVSSASPLAPTGISLLSENALEGPINLGGQLPLLSTVALEGQVSTAGTSGASYSCGNGNVGIISEGLAGGLANGYGYGAGYGNFGRAGLGLPRAGVAGVGGCGRVF